MSAEDEDGTTGEATVQAGAKDWEQGQIRIFSKMVSLMLGRALVSIPDDLKDGLVLENLVEKLSNKKTGINFEDGDTGRMATVARLNKLVDFLKKEGVHVTADGNNIFNGDVKMMLGLIWTLIYHYQITNKAEILKWVKGLCAPLNIPVVNFTTSWNSGLPLCVLSEALAHKRGVEHGMKWPELQQSSVADRTNIAVQLGDKMGIPALLDVEDVMVPRPDERLILTYVSYFYNAFLHAPEPPPPPSPVDNTELLALRGEVERLRNELAIRTEELRAEKEAHSSLQEATEIELRELSIAYDMLSRRLLDEQNKLTDMTKKLNELARKFALSKDSAVPTVAPPTDDVTFVVISIQGRNKLWAENIDVMYEAVDLFNRKVRARIIALDGYEVKNEAEIFTVAFSNGLQALQLALALQEELLHLEWPPQIGEYADAKTVQGPNGDLLFAGLRICLAIHAGCPILSRDPSTGKYTYSGPVVNTVQAISGVCQGGQILLSNDALVRVKDSLSRLGRPDVAHLGEVSFSDLKDTVVIYQVLPISLLARTFKPLPSPEKLGAVMAGLETELGMLEQENQALRNALSQLHQQSQAQKDKVSTFASWLRSKTTGSSGSKDNLSQQVSALLDDQKSLEKAIQTSDLQNSELRENVVALRRNLDNAEKACHILQDRYISLQDIHSKCSYAPSPPQQDLVVFKDAPLNTLVKAPREVLTLVHLHPALRVSPDMNKHGNWIVGDTSYSLREIYDSKVDPIDLLPTREERDSARDKTGTRASVARKLTRPKSSMFSVFGSRRTINDLSSFDRSTEAPTSFGGPSTRSTVQLPDVIDMEPIDQPPAEQMVRRTDPAPASSSSSSHPTADPNPLAFSRHTGPPPKSSAPPQESKRSRSSKKHSKT